MDALRMDSSAGVRSVSLQHDQPLALRWSRSGGLSVPWVRITRIQAGDTRCLPHQWTGDDGLVGTRGDVEGLYPHRPEDQDARQLGPWRAWGDHRCGRMRSSVVYLQRTDNSSAPKNR